jgi:hypothetical protein
MGVIRLYVDLPLFRLADGIFIRQTLFEINIVSQNRDEKEDRIHDKNEGSDNSAEGIQLSLYQVWT